MTDLELVQKWAREKALKIYGIIKRMNLCACGTGARWICILELLTEAEKHPKGGESFYRDKWFEFGAKALDSWDLIEHGTGIGMAWLTDDGRLLLDFLRDFGIDDHDFNDGGGHPLWAIESWWDETGRADDSYAAWLDAHPFKLENYSTGLTEPTKQA